jgi:hypothetical protein
MPRPADTPIGPAAAGGGPSRLRLGLAAILTLGLGLARTDRAWSQDDGPRVYQLAPLGAKAFTAFAVVKRGNETPENGDVIPGSRIDTNILVLRYVQTFGLGGRQVSPFVILPTGYVRSTVHAPTGDVVTESSGLGDAQIGGTIGLFGAPALAPDAYAQYRAQVSTGLLARVFFPTGAYSRGQPVNLGAHRYAFQLGLPTGLVFGQTYLDPTLTTLELLPTITFYGANAEPYGATRVVKAPQFSLEGHLTRNLGPAAWLSADVLYRDGGETTTDGRPDHNPTRGWSAGLSGAYRLAPLATVILTYEHVVERSDQGPDGWFFRTALVVPFR